MGQPKKIEWVVDPATGCWNCVSHGKSRGYPQICKNTGRSMNMHRYLYGVLFGDLDRNTHVRHKCDNRACINPEHLIPGTHADNMRDKIFRGRAPHGIDHSRAKLTEEQVIEIFLTRGPSIATIGKKYQVGHTAIWKIRHGLSWSRVTKSLKYITEDSK